MRSWAILLLLLGTALSVCSGQTVNKAEYFIDTDPGFGSGTPITITPAATITNFNFSIPVTSLAEGVHALHVRARNSSNKWGLPVSQYFFKYALSATALANVKRIEYFIDTDPGFGNGTPLTFTAGTIITDLTFSLPMAALTDGVHVLYVRAKDANNVWGETFRSPFFKQNITSATLPNIKRIEYFIDTDPGFGNGTPLAITPAGTVTDLAFSLPMSALTDGVHTLFVRAKNVNNNWGLVTSDLFFKQSIATSTLTNIDRIEYYINTDPGYGKATPVAFTPSQTVTDLTINISVSALAEGSYKLFIRARNVNKVWSFVQIKDFTVCNHPGTTASAATSVTSSSFTASWPLVSGSIGYRIDVSTDNFTTFVSGYNNKAVASSSTVVSGLDQATTYQYRVRTEALCSSINSNVVSVTTLLATPSGQPTNFQFNSHTTSSFTAFFTQPSPVPTGYLVVRKIGSSPTFVPQNNTAYAKDQIVGDGIVAYVGPNFLFNETGLPPNTLYYYDVFSYNQSGAFVTYISTSPLEGNTGTLAALPSAQPTSITFPNASSNGLAVAFAAAAGSPAGYIAIRSAGTSPTGIPQTGTNYTLGQTIGNGVVAYIGSAVNFSNTGLTASTQYYYDIFSYNGSGSTLNYLTTAPLEGSSTTLAAPPAGQPSNVVFSNVTTTSIQYSFTAAVTPPTGYIVVRQAGSYASSLPSSGTTYPDGTSLGTAKVVHSGTELTFNDTGLTIGTTYYYQVYSYFGSASLISYNTTTPAQNAQSTIVSPPANQPSAPVFSFVTNTSMTFGYTAAVGSPTGYLVLRKAGSVPTAAPVPGTTYTASPPTVLGDGEVVYVGSSTSSTYSSLTSGVIYYYKVFAYNGSGIIINYQTSTPLQGSQSTNAGDPSVQPNNLAFTATENSISAAFSANGDTPTGYIAFRKASPASAFVPVDGTVYTKGGPAGDATVAYVGGLTSFTDTGLTPETSYGYSIYAYNGTGASINYLTAAGSPPLMGIKSTVASPPTSQPTNLFLSDVTSTSINGTFTAASGSPKYIVFRKASSAPTFVPVDGNSYAVGNDMGGNTLVAYAGPNTSFVDAGLGNSQLYYYSIFSFTGTGATSNYLTTSPLQGNKTTVATPPSAPPTGFLASLLTQSSFTISFQPATGALGHLVIRKKNSAPTAIPVNGTVYTSGPIGDGEVAYVGSSTTFLQSGLDPVTNYYYSVYAYAGAGQTISYQMTPLLGAVSTLAIEPANQPTALSFSERTPNSMRITFAKAVGDPSGYLVFRSKDIPSTAVPVDGQALLTAAYSGSDVTFLDFGLEPYTEYFYTVYSFNGSNLSINYNTASPLVGNGKTRDDPPTLVNNQSDKTIADGDQPSIAATFSDAQSGVSAVTLFYKQVETGSTFTELSMSESGGQWRATIPTSGVGQLGTIYFFKATNGDDITGETSKEVIGVSSIGDGFKIPYSTFGNEPSDYRIISIPLELSNATVQSILEDDLGALDKTKWRLYEYKDGANRAMASSSQITAGSGYWLIVRKGATMDTGPGATPELRSDGTYTMTLNPGWNLIGNPFPFNLSWTDVKAVNPGLGDLTLYNGSYVEGDRLEKFAGGWLMSDGTDIHIPATKNTSINNKSAGTGPLTNAINSSDWEVIMHLKSGNMEYHSGGFGMSAEASDTYDGKDKFTVPRFISYLELNHSKKYMGAEFARDIVTSVSEYAWDFEVNSNAGDQITLTWDNSYFGTNDRELILWDEANQRSIDMREYNQYVASASGQRFKVYYGSHEFVKNNTRPQRMIFHSAFPNPSSDRITFSFTVDEAHLHQEVTVQVFDLTGKMVYTFTDAFTEIDTHAIEWAAREKVGPGLYVALLTTGSSRFHQTFVLK